DVGHRAGRRRERAERRREDGRLEAAADRSDDAWGDIPPTLRAATAEREERAGVARAGAVEIRADLGDLEEAAVVVERPDVPVDAAVDVPEDILGHVDDERTERAVLLAVEDRRRCRSGR